MELLRYSYYLDYSLHNYSDFMKVITLMQDNMVIELKDTDKVVISASGIGPRITNFYLSLIRPEI